MTTAKWNDGKIYEDKFDKKKEKRQFLIVTHFFSFPYIKFCSAQKYNTHTTNDAAFSEEFEWAYSVCRFFFSLCQMEFVHFVEPPALSAVCGTSLLSTFSMF